MRLLTTSLRFLAGPLALTLLAACSSSSSGGGGTGDDGGPHDGATADTSTADAPHDGAPADSPADAPATDAADAGGDAEPADAHADASDASADAGDSGAPPGDSGGDASDSGGDASDGSGGGGDGGPLAAGTYACATCASGEKYVNGVCYSAATAGPDIGCADPATTACSTASSLPTCTAGKCTILSCFADFADCDHDPATGCETDLRTAGNCGACGAACTAGQVCGPNGCSATCNPPLTNCSGICVDLTSDPLFCGACTTPCGSSGGTVGTCTNGACVKSCAAGFTSCSGQCAETAVDPKNCGSCGKACAVPSGGVATCSSGQCGALCPPGTQLCGGSCVVESLDAANCGACGHACGASEVCLLGTCTARAATVLASGLTGGVHVAVDASRVYFVDGAGVHAVPKTGGAVKDLAPATGKPVRVAVDATYAYWSENLGASIMRAPKDGSGSPALVAAAVQPQGLAVVGGTVYWVSNLSTDESIHQAPAAGGTATTFVTLSDASHIPSGLQELATDGVSLYAANEQAAYQVPILAGGTAGTPVGVSGGGVQNGAGMIAARTGEFCGFWSGLSGLGYSCQKGGVPLVQGDSPGAFTLPACGIAYGRHTGVSGQNGTYVVADRDLLLGRRVEQTLSPDATVSIASDGLAVYFLDTAGELRVLPVP